jgi:hypothetical protein
LTGLTLPPGSDLSARVLAADLLMAIYREFMPGFVSVPEKTLEHWSSQYITYRYRSRAALWWPAAGEDINIHVLPARPGKAVQLELKSTTVVRPGVHEVRIDLGQLWDYCQRHPRLQPFYAFPRPDPGWNGMLTAEAAASGRAVTELAFARSGPGWWFADWMIVMTPADVARMLHKELTAHGSRKRKKTAVLVTFENAVPRWKSGGPSSLIKWRDLWPELEACGRPEWPQLILLPARLLEAKRPLRHGDIANALREAAGVVAEAPDPNEPYIALAADDNGFYKVLPDEPAVFGSPGRVGQLGAEVPAGASDNRQIVFLDALALRDKPRR